LFLSIFSIFSHFFLRERNKLHTNPNLIPIVCTDKNVRKREAVAKKLENEKASMISRGLNPYVEFKKREVEVEVRLNERINRFRVRVRVRVRVNRFRVRV
jgi:hypothetical protein